MTCVKAPAPDQKSNEIISVVSVRNYNKNIENIEALQGYNVQRAVIAGREVKCNYAE